MDIETYLRTLPVEENGVYKFFVDKWQIDKSNYRNSKAFAGMPVEFPRKEKRYYEMDGAPAFSLRKSEVQLLVNELCNRLGFKPE